MRSRALLAGVLVLIGTVAFACAPGSGGSGRQVLVDYNNPDFAAIALDYFPNTVTVHPGDIVHFRQAWNGEPHSVTMGTLVDDGLNTINPLLPQFQQNGPPSQEAQDAFKKAFEHLPDMLGDNQSVIQPAAQPCYIDKGGVPPSDPKKPCPKRVQPDFNGTQAYYSSGYIPYAGNNGNSFDVKLSKSIKPGTYHYYCSVHGPQMQGRIIVKSAGAAIPSQGAVDRAALSQANALTESVRKALKQVNALPKFDLLKVVNDISKFQPPPTENQIAKLKDGYFAGFTTNDPNSVLANEFVPRTIHAKVGQKVTWAMIGEHTVSFNVPRYVPVLTIKKDGTIAFNPVVNSGSGPKFPKDIPEGAGDTYILDGGTWNGSGFHSSGLDMLQGDNSEVTGYSLTFSQPGTYQYACLIHPKMVGTVVVK